MHHYIEFFKAIRKHVREDNVNELIDHLGKQKDFAPFDEELGLDSTSSEDKAIKKLKV